MILGCRLLLPARGILVQSEREESAVQILVPMRCLPACAMPLTELLQFAHYTVHSTRCIVHSK